MKKRILGAAVAAATSAAILLSACGVDAPAGEAEPRDPQDGGAPSTGSSGNSGTAPAQTSGVASGQEAARRALAAAKARWRNAGLSAYSFRFVRYCECDESFGGPFDVRVVDERVLDFRRAGVQADLAAATTISELFVAIAAAIDRGVSVTVTYDPQFGYPLEVRLDLDAIAVDGGLALDVLSLDP